MSTSIDESKTSYVSKYLSRYDASLFNINNIKMSSEDVKNKFKILVNKTYDIIINTQQYDKKLGEYFKLYYIDEKFRDNTDLIQCLLIIMICIKQLMINHLHYIQTYKEFLNI